MNFTSRKHHVPHRRSLTIEQILNNVAASPAQLAGGIPGRDVRRQQTVRSRTKVKGPTAISSPLPRKVLYLCSGCVIDGLYRPFGVSLTLCLLLKQTPAPVPSSECGRLSRSD